MLGEGRLQMSEDEGYEVLKAYGIPVPPTRLATTPDEAAAAARALGLPVVLKVASADIAHKTDAAASSWASRPRTPCATTTGT